MDDVDREAEKERKYQEWSEWCKEYNWKMCALKKDINLLGANLNLESKLNRFVKELNGVDGYIFGRYKRDINIEKSNYGIIESKTGIVIADFRIDGEDNCNLYGRVFPDLIKEKYVTSKILRFFGENKIVVDSYEEDSGNAI